MAQTFGIILVFTSILIGAYVLITSSMVSSPIQAVSHCTTPTPEPTPIPIWSLYSEWITMPGTGVGWIRTRDFEHVKNGLVTLAEIPRLSDQEWQGIRENHGLPACCYWTEEGLGEGFAFSRIQGFATPYNGTILKDSWLPERLRDR